MKQKFLAELYLLGLVALCLWTNRTVVAAHPAFQLPTQQNSHLVVKLPSTDVLALGRNPVVALSPDGTRVVYVANRAGSSQLYTRILDRSEATSIAGSEGAEEPFFSPDGRWVGFFADGKLKKVSFNGMPPSTVCSAPANRGVSWGPDDTIVLSPSSGVGLFRVPATGGTPEVLTTPDRKIGEYGHRWPEILPGGKALIFTIWTGAGLDNARIGLLSLETGERRVLVEGGTYARYVSSGHIVYAHASGLFAVPFDLKRLQVTGPPVSVLEGVRMNPTSGAAEFSVSADGSIAYIAGSSKIGERSLVWVDRSGASQSLPAPPRTYVYPRISPDGKRLAVGIEGDQRGVWLYDLERKGLTWLTPTVLLPFPIWTPDGKHVTFTSSPGNGVNLFWIRADGGGPVERLTTGDNNQSTNSWSPDGQELAFTESGPTTGSDIWVQRLGGDRKARPFLQTRANEGGAAFSPDGHWLAYESDETGQEEIYVRPFPGPGGKWQISTGGGTQPMWAWNGQELFYRSGDKFMSASIEAMPAFVAAKPRLLFEGQFEKGSNPFFANYDVARDGQRFLMIKQSEQEILPTEFSVEFHWGDKLRGITPSEKH
jgi:Tol biopolymer transport system component